MILKQGHTYEPMPHDGKVIRRIYRGGRCYYHDGIYSLAATQALKAAFPQYWTAIRDYGYAHPQLVPFVNEDPMLIVSLVEVGKVRTATIRNKSVDNHLYNGLILPTPFSAVGKMEMTIQTEHNNAMILSGAKSNTTMSGYYSFGGNNALGAGTITRIGTWSLNELVSVGLDFVANTKAQNIRICGWSNNSWNYDVTIKNWDIYGTDDITLLYLLVPFLTSEGEVCFLDLVNLQLHHNVYTDPFTIEITDKAT